MSSKEKNEKLKELNENENENENEDYENETMDQNEIKKLNDSLDKIIDKSKLFEDQIQQLKKLEDLKEHLSYNDYDDQALKFKFFKLKLADISNEIDKKLFEQIFGHTIIKLADKLINTINKEENKIIVNDINSNENKLLERDEFGGWVIKTQQRSELKYPIDLILNFNETIQLDLV